MKKNRVNLIYSIILSGLLIYLLYLIRTVYPFIMDSGLYVCRNCLNTIFPFVQKMITVLLLVSFTSLLVNYIKSALFKRNLRLVSLKPKIISSFEEKYHLQDKIAIFKDQKLMAFCMGVFNPKIFLSSQVLKSMTHREIEAIILHERQHVIGKDNLTMLFLNLVKNALFFFPIVTDFVNGIEVRREIVADQSVTRETGRKIDIVSALRKVIESKPSFMYATAFSEDLSIEPRIRSLVGKKNRLLSIKYSSVVISLSVLLFLMNITLSRVEIHPQTNSATMLCIDKGTCQNSCQ